ncbi:MAG: hypothetical protein QOF46_604 [Paraburkholderia sp.]|nr:hypothetical protein [Paraburkholderia sp.]
MGMGVRAHWLLWLVGGAGDLRWRHAPKSMTLVTMNGTVAGSEYGRSCKAVLSPLQRTGERNRSGSPKSLSPCHLVS